MRQLCDALLDAHPSKRFVFGRNVYGAAVASRLEVAAFVDDFTDEREYAGAPVVRTADIPLDAIVLAASGGRPLTVRRMLEERGLTQLDYFGLLKWSSLDLPEAVFNEGFQRSFHSNRDKVDWLFQILEDDTSRDVLRRLFNFRYTYDLDCLNDFEDRQAGQYFEPFLDLRRGRPIFVDVGGFDGFTSEEFIRRSPDYAALHVFEPDPTNYRRCENRLAAHRNVYLWPYGAGSSDVTLRFSSDGSASSFRQDGEIEVVVRRIDDVVADIPTLIKMDIEGAELAALEGARRTITEHRPALAICVYHSPTHFWHVPEMILAMNPDYAVYLRHYTECIYETVMYFVPRDRG